MINIDLNPKKRKKTTKKFHFKGLSLTSIKDNLQLREDLVLYLIPFVTLLSTLGLYLYIDSKYTALEEERKSLENQINTYKSLQANANKIKKEFEKILEEEKKIQLKLKIFESLTSQKKSLTPILNTVVTKIPDGVWLESVELDGNICRVTGSSLNSQHIINFYKNISLYFEGANFGKVKDKQEVQGIVRQVSLSGTVYYRFSFELLKYKGL